MKTLRSPKFLRFVPPAYLYRQSTVSVRQMLPKVEDLLSDYLCDVLYHCCSSEEQKQRAVQAIKLVSELFELLEVLLQNSYPHCIKAPSTGGDE